MLLSIVLPQQASISGIRYSMIPWYPDDNAAYHELHAYMFA
jgi:hypothetical protein